MQRYVLTIGSNSELDVALRMVANEHSVQVSSVANIADAKRMLIKQLPLLILCSVEVDLDPQAGVGFCQQIQDHPQLGAVPVILFSAKVNQDVVRNAAQSGARGFITLPTTADMLRHRLGVFLVEPSEKKIAVHLETPTHSVATSVQVPVTKAPVSKAPQAEKPPVSKPPVASREGKAGQVKIDSSIQDVEDEELKRKLEIAQVILSKVLHNLRTSQLLQVVDLEDVPKVVSEITRSVCGVQSENKSKGK